MEYGGKTYNKMTALLSNGDAENIAFKDSTNTDTSANWVEVKQVSVGIATAGHYLVEFSGLGNTAYAETYADGDLSGTASAMVGGIGNANTVLHFDFSSAETLPTEIQIANIDLGASRLFAVTYGIKKPSQPRKLADMDSGT